MAEIKLGIKKLLIAAGVKGEIELTTPPNPEMGDFSFACFNLAKEWKISPVETAKSIKSKLEIGNWKLQKELRLWGLMLIFICRRAKLPV